VVTRGGSIAVSERSNESNRIRFPGTKADRFLFRVVTGSGPDGEDDEFSDTFLMVDTDERTIRGSGLLLLEISSNLILMGGGGRGAHELLADDTAGYGGGEGVSVRGQCEDEGVQIATEATRAEDTLRGTASSSLDMDELRTAADFKGIRFRVRDFTVGSVTL